MKAIDPVDFALLLTELNEAGVSDYLIAETTGIERSTISKLRQGKRKQPNFNDGASIVNYYQRWKSQKKRDSKRQ